MKTREVVVGSVTLSVSEAGAGDRSILLLHGFTGAKEDFTEWLDPLADAGWHAVAPDHRGHGASSHPPGTAAYSMPIIAADAVGLADALGLRSFVLLGHSMGGYVAQHVARSVPDRLAGLVLMDTAHGALEGVDRSMVELAIKIVQESGLAALAEAMKSREAPLDTPAHQRVLAERPDYQEFNDRKFLASSPDMYAAIVPELLEHPDMLGDLEALDPTPPTLVIVGDQDKPFLGPSERMAKAISGARLAVIPDAGHSPQFESPAAWWAELSGFLAELPA